MRSYLALCYFLQCLISLAHGNDEAICGLMKIVHPKEQKEQKQIISNHVFEAAAQIVSSMRNTTSDKTQRLEHCLSFLKTSGAEEACVPKDPSWANPKRRLILCLYLEILSRIEQTPPEVSHNADGKCGEEASLVVVGTGPAGLLSGPITYIRDNRLLASNDPTIYHLKAWLLGNLGTRGSLSLRKEELKNGRSAKPGSISISL